MDKALWVVTFVQHLTAPGVQPGPQAIADKVELLYTALGGYFGRA